MRKSFKMIFAASLVALAAVGCARKDALEEVIGRVDGIENRVTALENTLKQLNEQDVPSLKSLVEALRKQITVTSVVLTEDGYTLTFSDGTVAELKNGKDGKNGQDHTVIYSGISDSFINQLQLQHVQ